MKFNLVTEPSAYSSLNWLEGTVGTVILAVLWTFNNPFGDAPSID